VGTLKLKLGKDTQRTRSIYRDPAEPESRRLRAAIEALAYESFAQRLDRTIARSKGHQRKAVGVTSARPTLAGLTSRLMRRKSSLVDYLWTVCGFPNPVREFS
jgi:hypothetical protein